jgi:ankyrin repeat protein
MKYIKLFEDFKVEDIPQTEPQFTQWMIKNAPKAVTNPQEWFESEMAKPERDWAYIGFIIKELGLANRLSIAKGDMEEIRELRGWSKEFIDSLTLLHWAAQGNNIELAKMLIDAGADLDAKDYTKNTSLHLASKYNHTELAKMLIDAGADVNAKDSDKLTPLHGALLFSGFIKNTKIFEILIEGGANVNAKDKDKWTPLHWAAIYNRLELAKMLIDAGADVNAEDKDKKTPWDLANPQMREALPELNPNGESL